MKKMKQLILLTLCVFTLFGMTACAGKDKTDNAADQTTTDKDRDNDRNDASDKSDKKGDGILDDAVNDVTQGVDDVTDDVTDGIDDVTDDVTDGVDKNSYKIIGIDSTAERRNFMSAVDLVIV